MFLKLSITTLSLVVLAGCSVNYKSTTDYKLCYSNATLPSYNIHTDNREAEIRSRGLDCRVYADRIDEQQRAVALAKAGATKINNTTKVHPPVKWKNDVVFCNKYGTTVLCN